MSRQFRSTVRDEFQRLVDECEEVRLKYRGRSMPRAIAEEFSEKVRRAERLADALDDDNARRRWRTMSRTAWEREIPADVPAA